MRPLLVLSLVIVAVATLLFALFSLGGGDPIQDPVAMGDARSAPPREAPPPVEIEQPAGDGGEATEPTTVDRSAVATARDGVQGDRLSFDNALAGQVFDPDGQPLAGVRITVVRSSSPIMGDMQKILGPAFGDDGSRRTDQTDAEGRYRIRNLEPGMHFLTASHKSYSRSEMTIPMIPFEGEIVQDVELEVGVVVHGYVRDRDGNPIEGAQLTLGSINLGQMAIMSPRKAAAPVDDESLQTTASGTGLYRFTNVTPGPWHLTAAAKGFGSKTNRNLNISANIPANVSMQNEEMSDEEETTQGSFDFVLEPGEAIAGRVYAPDRTPIVGAIVGLLGYQPPQSLSAHAVTDAAGEFQIPDLVAGAYFLNVSAEGWGEEKLLRVEAPNLDVAIEMAEQGTILGKVVAADNTTPVTSFTASLHQYVAESSAFGRAKEEKRFDSPDGTFAMRGVAAGLYGVKIEAPGYATTFSASFEVVQGLATTDIVVRMTRGGSIAGIVVDAETGEPIAGAAITTQDSNYTENALTRMFASAMPRKTSARKTRTDKDGAFEINLLSPELYQILVQHPKHPDHVERNVRVVEGERTDLTRIEVPRGGTIVGTVYDAAGNPLANAVVQLTATESTDFMPPETRTGPDGRYVIPNVLPGPYKLSATRPHSEENPFRIISDIRHSQIDVTVSGGEKHSFDLTLGG